MGHSTNLFGLLINVEIMQRYISNSIKYQDNVRKREREGGGREGGWKGGRVERRERKRKEIQMGLSAIRELEDGPWNVSSNL